jgi:hypothetical protein
MSEERKWKDQEDQEQDQECDEAAVWIKLLQHKLWIGKQ